MNADTGRAVSCLKIFRDLRGHCARHDAACELDDIDLKTLDPRGGGEFKPDETGADDNDVFAGRDAPAQILAVIEDAQVTYIGQIGVGNIDEAIARAGREHQMAIVEQRAGRELQLAQLPVDRESAIRNQLDVLVGKEFARAEHQAVRAAGSLEVGLGQRRPLVGQMRLVIDQADRFGKAVLAQRGRDLKPSVTGACDQNWSLRHRSNPIASAQELPMSSPLPPILAGSPRPCTNGARGRVRTIAGSIWPHG